VRADLSGGVGNGGTQSRQLCEGLLPHVIYHQINPAVATLTAIGLPILPRPMKPTRVDTVILLCHAFALRELRANGLDTATLHRFPSMLSPSTNSGQTLSKHESLLRNVESGYQLIVKTLQLQARVPQLKLLG